MKVFLAGGSGAIGKPLIPLLVSYGHHVVATTRHQTKTNDLRLLGAEPVVLDALDRAAVVDAVVSASPDDPDSGFVERESKTAAGLETNIYELERWVSPHVAGGRKGSGVRTVAAVGVAQAR